jgi:hypothetical protein
MLFWKHTYSAGLLHHVLPYLEFICNLVLLSKVHPLYERGYVIPCIGNLTYKKSFVYLNFPEAYQYQNYVENKI